MRGKGQNQDNVHENNDVSRKDRHAGLNGDGWKFRSLTTHHNAHSQQSARKNERKSEKEEEWNEKSNRSDCYLLIRKGCWGPTLWSSLCLEWPTAECPMSSHGHHTAVGQWKPTVGSCHQEHRQLSGPLPRPICPKCAWVLDIFFFRCRPLNGVWLSWIATPLCHVLHVPPTAHSVQSTSWRPSSRCCVVFLFREIPLFCHSRCCWWTESSW